MCPEMIFCEQMPNDRFRKNGPVSGWENPAKRVARVDFPAPLGPTMAMREQPENTLLPIEVTEAGIVTHVKLLQYLKAWLPIDVTEPGIITALKPEQL